MSDLYHRPDHNKIQALKDLANKLRIHSIESTNKAGSGHPTSCCSCAEILSVLFFDTMRYIVQEPRDPSSDRFVMSKGHACPALYAAWAEAGLFPTSDLIQLRKFTSDLEGHPTPRLSFVDVATGSLGQGLSCAAGMAYTGKYFDKASYRVYCLVGDGETAEGSVWEAMHFISLYKLDNLVAIFDVNRQGQSDPTSLQHDMHVYKARTEAYGWNTIVIDGHNVEQLCRALYDANMTKGRPTCILAQTYKGKGIPGIEDALNWHGKPLLDKADAAIQSIRGQIVNVPYKLSPAQPVEDARPVVEKTITLSEPPKYMMGDKVAPRAAYGTALVKLGHDQRVIALDGDMKNSTFSLEFKKAYPERFIECYIAEQNLVGVAIGCGTRNRTVPFISTFSAFFSRAFDQIRMGAISQTNINFVGSHCGVSIGADGPSQMALEDLAMFRSIPGSTVFYPSDAVSAERAVELAANTKGICFVRITRPNVPVLYSSDEQFSIGKAKVVRKSNADEVTVVGSGVTLHEAINAADTLSKSDVHVRVIDPFTIKPIDVETIISNAQETGGRIVVVEDHYPEGGIGEAVASAVASRRNLVMKHLAVKEVPRSGDPTKLIEKYGIGAASIVKAIKSILSS